MYAPGIMTKPSNKTTYLSMKDSYCDNEELSLDTMCNYIAQYIINYLIR